MFVVYRAEFKLEKKMTKERIAEFETLEEAREFRDEKEDREDADGSYIIMME